MDNYVYIYFLGKIGGFGGLVRGKGRGGGGLIRFLEISRREYGDDWDPWMEMEDFQKFRPIDIPAASLSGDAEDGDDDGVLSY